MFKRLSRNRRRSVEEGFSDVTQNPTMLDEPTGKATGRKNSDGQLHVLNSTFLRAARSKYVRKSCGDAPTFASLISAEASDAKVDVVADYQMVTAVPAFIVEHEPEKQKSTTDWSFRGLSKKIDSFRRSSSRETISSIAELDSNYNNNDDKIVNNNKSNRDCATPDERALKEDRGVFGSLHRSPSPFKSFFIRIGSTGMLHSAKKSRRTQSTDNKYNKNVEKENLFRSCSTSQLNTSPTYVKGDDPSEGIDLQLSNKKDKTVSCDNLNKAQDKDIFDDMVADLLSTCSSTTEKVFSSYDFNKTKPHDSLRKSNSCDFKDVKKSSFPYAFLRSKLSVLPEERYGPKDERLFKTVSEEHFPNLIVEEPFDGTTTLGRRPKHGSNTVSNRYVRNNYAQKSNEKTGYEKERYSLSTAHFERIENGYKSSSYNAYSANPMAPTQAPLSVFYQQQLIDLNDIPETKYPDTLIIDPENCALRNCRRNSAPTEQRLSSHYVSSNESGYDSDGPRGSESTVASETEIQSLRCADGLDTNTLLDSGLERLIRQPNENAKDEPDYPQKMNEVEFVHNGTLKGLRWHQTTYGRMLPMINQPSGYQLELDQDQLKSSVISFHRAKIQQEKTNFLSEMIQPSKKVRRCRIVELVKSHPDEWLGIRLAQQRIDELRYVIVGLETNGVAHRDGRLRRGDEIVEIDDIELQSVESLDQAQNLLESSSSNQVRLKTVYEELVPQVYGSSTFTSECECAENTSKSFSKTSSLDSAELHSSTPNDSLESTNTSAASQCKRRPDYLPLSSSTKERNRNDNYAEAIPEAQQYLTKHIARFEKGYGKPSLGFSVVGGKDSPRGDMGIFVRRVFPGGQADVSKMLFQGDEIISLNGKILRGCTHQEVINLFKKVREGVVQLELARRHRYQKHSMKSAPC